MFPIRLGPKSFPAAEDSHNLISLGFRAPLPLVSSIEGLSKTLENRFPVAAIKISNGLPEEIKILTEKMFRSHLKKKLLFLWQKTREGYYFPLKYKIVIN